MLHSELQANITLDCCKRQIRDLYRNTSCCTSTDEFPAISIVCKDCNRRPLEGSLLVGPQPETAADPPVSLLPPCEHHCIAKTYSDEPFCQLASLRSRKYVHLPCHQTDMISWWANPTRSLKFLLDIPLVVWRQGKNCHNCQQISSIPSYSSTMQ